MGEALLPCPFERLAQIWGLLGEHVDDLVPVAVGRGPGDLVVTGQRVLRGAVAEPAQPQHRLPEAGQRPAAAWGAAAAPLGCQQLRHELHQLPRDVKRGTIGDHVESFSNCLRVSWHRPGRGGPDPLTAWPRAAYFGRCQCGTCWARYAFTVMPASMAGAGYPRRRTAWISCPAFCAARADRRRSRSR